MSSKSSYAMNGILSSIHGFNKVLFKVWYSSPSLLFTFWVASIQSFILMCYYYVFDTIAKPFRGDIALILGSESPLGQAFSMQIAKQSGTVILLDANKEKGEASAKKINGNGSLLKAYFYECDVTKTDDIQAILNKVSKEVGDVSMVFNCTPLATRVSTYFNVYKMVLPIMKGNKKGRLVFIRSLDGESRQAIQSLSDLINHDLALSKIPGVKTTTCHVYPVIEKPGETAEPGMFGVIKIEDLATTILDGIAHDHANVFIPSYMGYFNFWLRFVPPMFTNMWDDIFFGAKAVAKTPAK